MSVSSLREITVGVQDLQGRIGQFESGCGLSVLASGPVTAMTGHRLFDSQIGPSVAVLGRPDVPGSPRIRLVQVGNLPSDRARGIDDPGALGIGFGTTGIGGLQARLGKCGVQFVSPPVVLTPLGAAQVDRDQNGTHRLETFGRSEDGDFIVLIERVNAATPSGVLDRLHSGCSEPLHASFVVTNLEASTHFMSDVLEHEVLLAEECAGPPFDTLLGLPIGVSFRTVMAHRAGWPTGRCVFMEFQKKLKPMAQIPSLRRGLCRLRYDTTDIHASLARLPGGGGSLVRGPVGIDDPILGRGLVAMVRAPFGVLIELWQP